MEMRLGRKDAGSISVKIPDIRKRDLVVGGLERGCGRRVWGLVYSVGGQLADGRNCVARRQGCV